MRSNEESPVQYPDVKGWEGLADLAQVKTFMQKGKLLSPFPELPTSLYKSHITTVSEFLKVPTMSTT